MYNRTIPATRFKITYFVLFGMYALVVPYYQLLLDTVGYSRSEIGLLLGSFELFGILGPFLLGNLADRTGRFRLVIGLATAAAALMLLPLTFSPPLITALAVSALFGFGFKSNVPLVDALSGHLLPDPDHDYGRVRMWGSIAFTLMVIIVGRTGMMNGGTPRSMVIPMVTALGIFLLFSRITLQNPLRNASADRRTLPEKRLSPWLYVSVGVIFLINFGFAAYTSFFSLYLVSEVGVTDVGLLWAIGAAAEIPIIFLSGRLIRRFGPVRMLTASAVATLVRLTVYGTLPYIWAVAPVQILHAVCFGVMHTAGVALVRLLAPPGKRAVGQALYTGIGMGLALFTGAAAGGFIAEQSGYRIMYLWAGVPVALGLVAVLLISKPLAKATGFGGIIER